MSGAPPNVGLVLGAGGVAGGAFHAGALAALAEVTRWDPRTAAIVVGTSAGSIAGTGLRAGLSAADSFERSQGRPMSAAGQRLLGAFGGPPTPPRLRPGLVPPSPSEVASLLGRAVARPFAARPTALLAALLPEGATATDMIRDGVRTFVPQGWPSDPLWINAVNRNDGLRATFGRYGIRDTWPELGDAVAASCAIPGIFTPVQIDGASFVDGGVHSPTNADVLIDAGVSLVIVSSPMSIAGRGLAQLTAGGPMRRWARLCLDAEIIRLRRRGIAVITLQPTAEDAAIMGPNAMDPSRRSAIADAIRASTLTRLERADVADRLALLRR